MRTFSRKQKATQQISSVKSTMPSRAHFGAEVNSILHLQHTIGNQALLRLLQTNAEERKAEVTSTAGPRFGHDSSWSGIDAPPAEAIRTNLPINKPGDIYEEADRVSKQVMNMSAPQLQRTCACGGKCSTFQTKQPGQQHEQGAASDLGQTAVPPIVEVLRSPGQSLDPASRLFMERRFGHDFDKLRVHKDAKAAESAQAIGAAAYTIGTDLIYLAQENSIRRLVKAAG